MDNGQKAQNSSDTGFFTPGIGNIPADQNIPNVEDNLDLTNPGVTWAPERDNRNMGNRAIFSSEVMSATPASPNFTENFAETSANNGSFPAVTGANNLGQITNIAGPSVQPTENKVEAFDYAAIRTSGDHLASTAIAEIERAKVKLSQTGDICDFYNEIRDMMEQNLVNSYHRKLAA